MSKYKYRKRRRRLLLVVIACILFVLFIRSDWVGEWMYPIEYREDIRLSSEAHQVDPYLIAAIIRSESNYQTGRASPKGALGIMQIMPDTAEWIADQAGYTGITLDKVHYRPDVGIELGTWYVAYLLDQFDQDTVQATAAYNAGPGKVRSWLSEGVWDGTLESREQIPYGETKRYVQRVSYYYNKYKGIYDDI